MIKSFSKEDSIKVKGVAILMMLVHHLWGFPERIIGLELSSHFVLIGESCKLCVVIFLFLSGYGLSISSKGGRKINTTDRIWNIYKAFLRIFCLFIPLGLLLGYIHVGNIFEFLLNAICVDFSYNKEWWFIGTYIELLMLFPFLFKCKKCLWLIILVSSVIFRFCSGIIHFENSLLYLHVYSFLYYYPAFALGLLTGYYGLFEIALESFFSRKFVLCTINFLIIIACFIIRKKINLPIMTIVLTPSFCLLICILPMWHVCQNILSFLGKHSMNIWLTHTFIIYYYWQDWFIDVCMQNPIIGLVELIVISVIMVLAIEYAFNLLSNYYSKTQSNNN